jgi:hypothetical protein
MELTNQVQYALFNTVVDFIRARKARVYIQIQYDMIRTTADVSDRAVKGLLTINIDPELLYSMSMDHDFCTIVTKMEGVGDITLAFPNKAIAAVYSPDLSIIPVLFQFVISEDKVVLGTDTNSPIKPTVELIRNEPLIEVQPTPAKIYTFDPSLRGKKP